MNPYIVYSFIVLEILFYVLNNCKNILRITRLSGAQSVKFIACFDTGAFKHLHAPSNFIWSSLF